MNTSLFAGVGLALVAGVTMGNFLLPLKWARNWKWENTWLVFSLVSLLVLPLGLAFLLLPNLAAVYASLPLRTLLLPFVFGAGWGIAQVGLGLCVSRFGLALTLSLLIGVGAACGTIIPMMVLHPATLVESRGLLVLAGTLVMLAGVAVCAWAGWQREKTAGQAPVAGGYGRAVLLAVVSGVLSSLLNFALAFCGEIVQRAQEQGARNAFAPFAVWPIALLGGLFVNVGYSCYLLTHNQTWGHFRPLGREVLNPVLMGVMWMGAIALYSSGSTYLGVLGVSIGWALFQITMILAGNVSGLLTGEWQRLESRIYRTNLAGVSVLFLAIIIIGAADWFAG